MTALPMTAPLAPRSLPISVLTGFLGAGKTTYLKAVLRDPGMARTLVIINEAGEISLDDLAIVEAVEPDLVRLESGCLCCVLRNDLAEALRDILTKQRDGRIAVDRVVIETSGLASPGPLLYTLAADPIFDLAFKLDTVAVVVDSVRAELDIEAYAEPAQQIAVADLVLLSKTDLAAPSATLAAKLDRLNADARRIELSPASSGHLLFSGGWSRPGRHRFTCTEPGAPASHSARIATHSIILTEPMSRLDFAVMLARFAANWGEALLRLKGIVAFSDGASNPFIINAVRHTLYPPERLDAWPSGDQKNRLVVIAEAIPLTEILHHFAQAGARSFDAARDRELSPPPTQRRARATVPAGMPPLHTPTGSATAGFGKDAP